MLKMVMNKEVSKVVIAYPDNKVWILLEEFFKSYGTEIVVIINKEENKLYGMRSYKYKKVVEGAKKLMQDC